MLMLRTGAVLAVPYFLVSMLARQGTCNWRRSNLMLVVTSAAISFPDCRVPLAICRCSYVDWDFALPRMSMLGVMEKVVLKLEN